MPIRINLLAEAQTAEDLRRRDPVKRVIIAGILLVAVMVAWSSYLQLKVMMANRELSSVQTQVDSAKNAYQNALTNDALIAKTKLKLSALQKLTDARTLQGNLLNAMQKIAVDNVQLTRMKVDQGYAMVVRANKSEVIVEKTMVTLEARDSSPNPGDMVGKYKDALLAQPYFKEMLDPTNAVSLADESSVEQDNDGKNFVSFTLECHFHDKTR
jgi:hypothetical protein